MSARRFGTLAAAASFAALGVAGCLERKETITITKDGRVTIAIAYEGEKAYFETLDALPAEASGWKVEREVKKEGDKEVVTLTAERRFGPNEELPDSFAPANDPDSKLYLQFPTTVQRERRADGVYLHFRRIYPPRSWAYVQFWLDQLDDDNLKNIGEKKPEEVTPEERVELMKAFASAEGLKQAELAERALKESEKPLRQDHWLAARRALLNVYEEEVDWDSVGRRFEGMPQERRDAALEQESQRIFGEAQQAFIRSLQRDAGFDAERMKRFEAALAREKKYFEITNQLGAQAFNITVQMPGTIVAHNAEKSDQEDGSVQWEFDGTAFRDRPFELLVTSRLPLERDEK